MTSLGDAPFHILEQIDSTNNYAMGQISQSDIEEWSAYFAWQQTQGKGQRGKGWNSDRGKNILLSFVLRPHKLFLQHQFSLSATVALGAFDFFKNYAGDSCSIKWSNDIYWCDRKAGGILIENVLRGNFWAYAVVGIGININQLEFPDSLPNPISLAQITGKQYNALQLAKELLSFVAKRYKDLLEGNSQNILSAYQQVLYRRNEPCSFRKNGQHFSGIISGVEPDGKLVIRTSSGRKAFDFGEIEFVITPEHR